MNNVFGGSPDTTQRTSNELQPNGVLNQVIAGEAGTSPNTYPASSDRWNSRKQNDIVPNVVTPIGKQA